MRLPSYRYEQIKWDAVSLLDFAEENSAPIDPFAIASKLGIHVIAYGALGNEGRTACLKVSKSGFRYCLEGSDGNVTQYIYYSERKPMGHIRFTILHEIGHIFFGHLQESDVAEAEANFFAKYLIAPPALVDLIHPNDYLDIAYTFQLSKENAQHSWNYYQKWLHVRSHGSGDYEKRLLAMFSVAETSKGGDSMNEVAVLRTKKGA